jgi:hypothetical protein
MIIYPNLFAYLNNSSPVPPDKLQGSDRPIIVLEENEVISSSSLLIPINNNNNNVYELAFPYLQPGEINHENPCLQNILTLDVSGQDYIFHITDEVLDAETINEETQKQKWETSSLGNCFDYKTSNFIRLFVGIFNDIFSKSAILLIHLPEKLNSVNLEDANLPIVVSLDNRYQLRRKLEVISEKLRHQLKRQAELISVSKIQEMDSYCLRDYVRRPGLNAIEKAGSKQQLMGIKRYQDFNTPENKFLVYFSQILHLSCFEYLQNRGGEHESRIEQIKLTIDLFKNQPLVKTIQDRKYQFTKPNYVLQQNPIYRSFYQAYLDYLSKKYEKEKVWSFRNRLLADTVFIYLTAALLKFQNIGFDVNLVINGSLVPNQGSYLKPENLKIKVFLKNQVYVFELRKPRQEIYCDWVLNLQIHQLDSQELVTKNFVFPIWVFWYLPKREVLMQFKTYLINNHQNFQRGMVFYLQIPPNQSSPTGRVQSVDNNRLWFMQLPELNPKTSFTPTVNMIINMIINIVEGAV